VAGSGLGRHRRAEIRRGGGGVHGGTCGVLDACGLGRGAADIELLSHSSAW
jgi:hypothetical protein